jgi:transaldolase
MKNKINIGIAIYADGANLKEILHLNKFSFIKGFTTNPTLMKQSGVKDYKRFAIDLLSIQWKYCLLAIRLK